MKIKLSKEHIEKGCELVEGYSLRIDDSVRGDFKEHLRYKGFRENIEKSDSPRYRDFLQLVIEALQEKHATYITLSFYQENKTWTAYIESLYHDTISADWCVDEIKSATEAKEKALAYVFDNMEV